MFRSRFCKTAVSMLAVTLCSALLVVGCSDDNDNGDNNDGSGRDGRLVLPSGYAWVNNEAPIGDRSGFFLNADGTVQFFSDYSGVWAFTHTGAWSTSENNHLTFIEDGYTETTSYTITNTTLTINATDGDYVITFTRMAVTIGGSDDNGDGDLDGRLILPNGYAWVEDDFPVGDREGIIYNSDGTFNYVHDDLDGALWELSTSVGTWFTSGNNNLTMTKDEEGESWSFTLSYIVTNTTLSVCDVNDNDDCAYYTRTAVTIQ